MRLEQVYWDKVTGHDCGGVPGVKRHTYNRSEPWTGEKMFAEEVWVEADSDLGEPTCTNMSATAFSSRPLYLLNVLCYLPTMALA